jgi:hypothetical protein
VDERIIHDIDRAKQDRGAAFDAAFHLVAGLAEFKACSQLFVVGRRRAVFLVLRESNSFTCSRTVSTAAPELPASRPAIAAIAALVLDQRVMSFLRALHGYRAFAVFI